MLDLRRRRPIDPVRQNAARAFLNHARDRLTIRPPVYKYQFIIYAGVQKCEPASTPVSHLSEWLRQSVGDGRFGTC